MAVTRQQAREEVLDELGVAIDGIGLALSCLGAAYELLSVTSADRLEGELHRPVQKAYGRAKRAHAQFAERSGIEPRPFSAAEAGRPSQGVKSFVERAVEAGAEADREIAEIQDSALALESGDAELRAALSEVRSLLAELPPAARGFLRTLGR
jgi:hypothetical protein